MSPAKGGLGRGLSALIPSAPPNQPPSGPPNQSSDGPSDERSDGPPRHRDEARRSELREPEGGARFAEIAVSAIVPNAAQPRASFDEEEMAELVASIREVGLLQPVVVRPAGDGFELVMGERRLRAAKQAGLQTISAIVRDTGDEAMLRDALLENLHRSDLNPLEEAAAYAQLLVDFGTTQDELASRLGRSRPQISNTLRLLNLPAPVQRRVAAGVLSAGHARAILGLPTPEAMEAMAGRVVAEGMSVRAVEEAVAVSSRDDDGRPPRRPRRTPSAGASELTEQACERLATRLDTPVKVDVGRAKGKVTIEFGSIEDLQRIVDVIAPER